MTAYQIDTNIKQLVCQKCTKASHSRNRLVNLRPNQAGNDITNQVSDLDQQRPASNILFQLLLSTIDNPEKKSGVRPNDIGELIRRLVVRKKERPRWLSCLE